jgi:hypothetical protein
MFLRSYYIWIRSDANKRTRLRLTIYCTFVILLGWLPWNILLVVVAIWWNGCERRLPFRQLIIKRISRM